MKRTIFPIHSLLPLQHLLIIVIAFCSNPAKSTPGAERAFSFSLDGGFSSLMESQQSSRGWQFGFSGQFAYSNHLSFETSWFATSIQRPKKNELLISALSANLLYIVDKAWISPFIRVGAGIYLDNLNPVVIQPSPGYYLGLGATINPTDTFEFSILAGIHTLYMSYERTLPFSEFIVRPAIRF